MDPTLLPLLNRLDSLSEEFRELREGVHKAIQVAEFDPEMALTRARKVLEYVVRDVYERRVKEPAGTRPLENLLQRLVKDKFLPGRLDAYANAIRQLGNVGTHSFGEKITVADVNQSLSQLTFILEWYFEYERPGMAAAEATVSVIPPIPVRGNHEGRQQEQAPQDSARQAGGRWKSRGVLLAGLTGLLIVAAIGLWVGGVFRQTGNGGDQTPQAQGDLVAKVKRISGIELVAIPAGEFYMGSKANDKDAFDVEKPRHKVTISQPFYLGKYKVTVGQFKRFVQANPAFEKAQEMSDGGQTWMTPGFEQTDENPVVCISPNDADAFCQWLAKEAGANVRLPREAEWEYSCRAKATTKFYFGENEADLGQYAWYRNNTNGHGTEPCGLKKPNGFGLYDMHGLAEEWCSDGQRKYEGRDATDPEGPLGADEGRVFRGGSIVSDPHDCRAAQRHALGVLDWSIYTGFRVLVSP